MTGVQTCALPIYRVGRRDDVLSNDISNDMSSGAVGMTVNTSSSSMTSDDIMSE